MSERDYSKQLARRQRITRTTLVVGVDVGKAHNAVGFMNKEGKVLGSCAKVGNTREGFEQFRTMVEDLKRRHGLKDVLIGMEPTGHYWRKLAYFAKEQGYEVRFVRTTALKHHRELDESAFSKERSKRCINDNEHHPGGQVHRHGDRRWAATAITDIIKSAGETAQVQRERKEFPACSPG
jgi:transposase